MFGFLGDQVDGLLSNGRLSVSIFMHLRINSAILAEPGQGYRLGIEFGQIKRITVASGSRRHFERQKVSS